MYVLFRGRAVMHVALYSLLHGNPMALDAGRTNCSLEKKKGL